MLRLYGTCHGGNAVRGPSNIRNQLFLCHMHVQNLLAVAHHGQGYYCTDWVRCRRECWITLLIILDI